MIKVTEAQMATDEQTEKIVKFLEANAKQVSIMWKMRVDKNGESVITAREKKAIIYYNVLVPKEA